VESMMMMVEVEEELSIEFCFVFSSSFFTHKNHFLGAIYSHFVRQLWV